MGRFRKIYLPYNMRLIEQKYQEYKEQYGAQEWAEYGLPGGKVALNPNGLEAIVLSDGRYPSYEEGYQINDYITETETVLWGAGVIELPDEGKIIIAQANDSYSFAPKQRFSITGKCVCHVVMDQRWDSAQKHYVQ